MFKIEISQEDAQEFSVRFGNQAKARIRQGLALVRQEWQQEFRRQDERMQKVWVPLKTWVTGKTSTGQNPDPRSYAMRKRRAYYSGKGRNGGVRYLRILKRSGVMLERYIGGISINNTDMKVSIPFPGGNRGFGAAGNVGRRAMVHQGYDGRGNPVGLPKGVLAHRPYDTDRFLVTANRVLRRELYRA